MCQSKVSGSWIWYDRFRFRTLDTYGVCVLALTSADILSKEPLGTRLLYEPTVLLPY